MSGCDQSTVESLADDPTDSPFDADDCLKVRKYWCFLLSSIFTFLAGLLVVLLWRAFAFVCCRKEPDLGPNDPKQKEQKASRNKQEFEGTFMTEAKDWAGELISGQTTTGRILVSTLHIGRRPIYHLWAPFFVWFGKWPEHMVTFATLREILVVSYNGIKEKSTRSIF